jgi:hypothetical protein
MWEALINSSKAVTIIVGVIYHDDNTCAGARSGG